jgi:hypothetical protein
MRMYPCAALLRPELPRHSHIADSFLLLSVQPLIKFPTSLSQHKHALILKYQRPSALGFAAVALPGVRFGPTESEPSALRLAILTGGFRDFSQFLEINVSKTARDASFNSHPNSYNS